MSGDDTALPPPERTPSMAEWTERRRREQVVRIAEAIFVRSGSRDEPASPRCETDIALKYAEEFVARAQQYLDAPMPKKE